MKVIDLLNKIANGEEVPKKIRYDEYYYELKKEYNEVWKQWEYGYQTYTGGYLNIWRKDVLNDEVEIIEEAKKIPEKIEEVEIEVSMAIGEQICANKINEIIDYLKSKGE